MEKEVDVCLNDGGRCFLVLIVSVFMVMEPNVSGFIRDLNHMEVELISESWKKKMKKKKKKREGEFFAYPVYLKILIILEYLGGKEE